MSREEVKSPSREAVDAIVCCIAVALGLAALAAFALVEAHSCLFTRLGALEALLLAILPRVEVIDVAVTHAILIAQLPTTAFLDACEAVIVTGVGRRTIQAAERQHNEKQGQPYLSFSHTLVKPLL